MTGAAPSFVPAVEAHELAAAVLEAHADAFGNPADGVWAAPGRFTLVGEHVDYNDGLTLLVALPYRTVAAARRRTDRTVRVRSAQVEGGWDGSLDSARPGEVSGWAAYAVGAIWALADAGYAVPGLDVAIDSNVPLGSGLSSSAALVSSVAAAAAELSGADDLLADAPGRARLTELAVRAETDFVGAPTGGMDQAVSIRAQADHVLLLDCRDNAVRHVPFDLDRSGLALLVIDTRAEHSNVDGAYADRRRACERAAASLGVAALREVEDVAALSGLDAQDARRARHVVTEIARVRRAAELLDSGKPDQLGPLLNASHDSLRDDFEVSSRELDLAVDTARANGALGARMTGGGFGGSAISLVRQSDLPSVAATVADAFVAADLTPPRFLHGRPSGPARRVR